MVSEGIGGDENIRHGVLGVANREVSLFIYCRGDVLPSPYRGHPRLILTKDVHIHGHTAALKLIIEVRDKAGRHEA